jgi:NitT/TauT family transport system permease protein
MDDFAAIVDRPGAAATSSSRLRSLAGNAGRRLVTLLPGLALLAFWQWSSGRLIKEIYISKPTEVAVRLYELFSS